MGIFFLKYYVKQFKIYLLKPLLRLIKNRKIGEKMYIMTELKIPVSELLLVKNIKNIKGIPLIRVHFFNKFTFSLFCVLQCKKVNAIITRFPSPKYENGF